MELWTAALLLMVGCERVEDRVTLTHAAGPTAFVPPNDPRREAAHMPQDCVEYSATDMRCTIRRVRDPGMSVTCYASIGGELSCVYIPPTATETTP